MASIWLGLADDNLMLLILLATTAADYEILKADRHEPAPASFDKTVLPDEGGPPNRGGHANGFEAVFDNAAPHFRALPPLGGTPCGKRVKTSVTAKAHGCRWATNGAPFNMKTGECNCGIAISNSVQFGTGGWGRPQFGVTGDGRWVVGTINASVADALNITNSVNGFGWLVRNGVVSVSNQVAPRVSIAPRTVIGVKKDGRLLSLEVDGCEPQAGCLWHLGKTEHEMAELLVKRGAFHAINLDGGGSSSVVENGRVIDHPTDLDHWLLNDERAVTTIVCVL